MRTRYVAVTALIAVAPWSHPVSAVEECGDTVDNDSNGLADEGCAPALVHGITDSPLPSAATGFVAPRTGRLVYPEPPDIETHSAWGPSLRFQRTYVSQHQTISSPVTYRHPMGRGWTHNFMGWLEGSTSADPTQVVVRLVTGQDVVFSYASTDGSSYRHYTPQAGHHVKDLTESPSGSPRVWLLTMLDGSAYEFDWGQVGGVGNYFGQLQKIKDPLGQALTITYLSFGGQIDKVTDATTFKELRFNYYSSGTVKPLQSVKYYNNNVLKVTASFPNSANQTSVALGSNDIRTYTYTSNKLTAIASGSETVAEFTYLASDPGKTVRVKTGEGVLGYEYGDTSCNGGEGVYVWYNHPDDSPASCDADSDCGGGSGEFCGGETTPGATDTGICFRARRCVAVPLTSRSDDLITAVTSTGCTTCTGVKEYTWDAIAVNLLAMKSPDDVITSYLYDSNGMVTKIVENDSNTDASNVPANGARVTYFTYDTTFPGLVASVLRQSGLSDDTTCSPGTLDDCKITNYHYTSGGQLDGLEEIGFTHDAAGDVVGYDYETEHTYDAKGRLTETDGPRASTDDINEYTYYSDTDSDKQRLGMLKEVKRKKDASNYLVTTYDSYDGWGNATQVADPNANLTCLTFATDRNALTTERVAMANQTSCGTTDSSDLTTTYTLDPNTWKRTRIQKPIGNCTHYEFDSWGRLSKVKERDDCNAASSGHTQEFTYDADGLRTKVEYKDASGTVTYRRETTFGADRRLLEILNPSDTSKKKSFAYESDGQLDTVTGENGVGKTEWAYDNFNRATTEDRFNSVTPSPDSDTWTLSPDLWFNRLSSLAAEDTAYTNFTGWDDMGRKVSEFTWDTGRSNYVYDEAGNLVTHVESEDDADEMTHTFTYDLLNRRTAENYGDATCFTLGGAEIQYVYDSPGGCPTGTCVNSAGRVAYVKTKIRCDDAKSDDTFDQLTYFGYDDAGRTVKETIQDDGSREAVQNYSWDKNGNQTAVEAPSGVDLKWTLGSAGSNSDADRIVALLRNAGSDTTLASNAVWLPFGPMKEYEQANTISSNALIARFTWDLAHRPTEILWEQKTAGTDLFKIAYTLDAQGRITVKDFAGADADVSDSYYTYDWQNRITCDAKVSGSCPTSGSNVKTTLSATPPYSKSGDRETIVHKANGYPTTEYISVRDEVAEIGDARDQVDYVTRDGTHTLDFNFDSRGNRLYDDDDEYADDRRDYSYDGRNNLVSVAGKLKISDTVVHNYVTANAYDHRNRRFFKSIVDTTASPDVEEQWFYYYDRQDRLIEVKHTPDITDTSTYSLYQFYWIDQRPVAWVQTNYPSANTTRRFFHADHLDTPVEAYSWPTSGDASRVWAMQSDAFGWGTIVAGTAYQPLRFPGQMSDDETTALRWESSSSKFKPARPPLSSGRLRAYDQSVGAYLQADVSAMKAWGSYAFANNNPVARLNVSAASAMNGFVPYSIDDDGCSGTHGGGGTGGGSGGNSNPCESHPYNTTYTRWFSLDDPNDVMELAVCGIVVQSESFWSQLSEPLDVSCMCTGHAQKNDSMCRSCEFCDGWPMLGVKHSGGFSVDDPLGSIVFQFKFACVWECEGCLAREYRPFVDQVTSSESVLSP